MYLRTVRLLIWWTSLRSPSRIRFAPHVRFAIAICLINAMASGEIRGSRGIPFDLCRHWMRNPSRCHFLSVSGWTTMNEPCCPDTNAWGNLRLSCSDSQQITSQDLSDFAMAAARNHCPGKPLTPTGPTINWEIPGCCQAALTFSIGDTNNTLRILPESERRLSSPLW
jgi:hypothetical protein